MAFADSKNVLAAARDIGALCEAFARLDGPAEIRAFLEDLCTPAEIAAMADRWKAARLVSEGMAYREIYEKTGVSTGTVTRVARSLAFGAGGYRNVIQKMSSAESRAKRKRQ